jgi:hypothetical protein
MAPLIKRKTIRQRLAAMMERDFIVERADGPWRLEVDPEMMWFNRSASRSRDDTDGTFGGSALAVNPAGIKMPIAFGSYDTMTVCVKRGIGFVWRGGEHAPLMSGLDIIAKA